MHLGRRWFVIIAFGLTLLGFVVWLATSDNGLDTGDKVASIAGALIGFVTLLVTLRPNASTTTRDPGEAVEDLARFVTRQWEREADARGLTRHEPLDVRWASTERPVAPSAAEVVGTDAMAARPTRLKLHGGVEDLADVLRKLPGRQLVLLGEPGSGKTSAAALLTLRLLARRQAGEPVPVLFPLASWDPKTQDLETWMAQRISVDHPAFRRRGVHGPDAARDLVERGLVLPVLDALDEVASKVGAVQGIAQVVGRRKPMVLTCRADDYEEIIRETGVPVGRAAVVELKPVTAREAARYLATGTPDGDQRWQPVVTTLREEPEGVLARALSTPLSVYLAKTAYTPPSTNPADLLAHSTSTAVEHHLLEAYLPALYPAPEAVKARKWLAFLARRLAASPVAGNLAWWRLFLLLPKPHVVTSATRAGLAGAVLVAAIVIESLATGELYPLRDARSFVNFFGVLPYFLLLSAIALAPVGALVGAVATVLAALRPQAGRVLVPLPRNLVLTWRTTTRVMAVQLPFGALLMVLLGTFLWPGLQLKNLVLLGLLAGVAASVYSFTTTITVDAPVDGPSALASDRRTTLSYLSLWVVVYTGLAVVLSSKGGPVSPDNTVSAVQLTVAFATWLNFSGAWARFGIARLWFALFRKLPCRLMRFLDDAHRRGVLRQVGAAYEFRHQRLQQYFSQR
ncbi:hypothetical protein G7043_30865 [Lentzea sp. NEAU-D13]|uniref:NACHT domain-containing protein n=1 Tax=Lentzea alba TaxID=2714351 RepID=A0A7C9VUK9_9PSEU|nr:hypothetical protein [Lentzea alba]NGY63332.1 hypothetical protein [Lentzea alba]